MCARPPFEGAGRWWGLCVPNKISACRGGLGECPSGSRRNESGRACAAGPLRGSPWLGRPRLVFRQARMWPHVYIGTPGYSRRPTRISGVGCARAGGAGGGRVQRGRRIFDDVPSAGLKPFTGARHPGACADGEAVAACAAGVGVAHLDPERQRRRSTPRSLPHAPASGDGARPAPVLEHRSRRRPREYLHRHAVHRSVGGLDGRRRARHRRRGSRRRRSRRRRSRRRRSRRRRSRRRRLCGLGRRRLDRRRLPSRDIELPLVERLGPLPERELARCERFLAR